MFKKVQVGLFIMIKGDENKIKKAYINIIIWD